MENVAGKESRTFKSKVTKLKQLKKEEQMVYDLELSDSMDQPQLLKLSKLIYNTIKKENDVWNSKITKSEDETMEQRISLITLGVADLLVGWKQSVEAASPHRGQVAVG